MYCCMRHLGMAIVVFAWQVCGAAMSGELVRDVFSKVLKVGRVDHFPRATGTELALERSPDFNTSGSGRRDYRPAFLYASLWNWPIEIWDISLCNLPMGRVPLEFCL